MRETDIDGLRKALDEGATLIDVREPQEYAEAHVPGAVLIPMGQLSSRLDEVPGDRPVYVICRSGNRSGAMGPLLDANGFDSVNVVGGTAAWVQAGHPYDQGL
ncbi:rhodanese-like domain-containing protein [Nocardioides marmoribigeumensis]|jgi:rhodanese-related sulfurtransferase|uniref:Rhodanese-related sulfurtransferase n=1 Tax=Nocardioides marmoribigeumensis TaxID=433649 RepID=A0ABU2BW27_9ACTN|nr:rhodanese-like domain-containing protein [Nocardioides marmoribigeumensis]MDR7362219.1 rhodanese-related sulfurtransferase [Nocardioides marmoribigeumensis]